MNPSILITGASGSTGAATLNALTARVDPNTSITTMSRNAALTTEPGTRHVVADFSDSSSVSAALEGITAAYLVTPSTERAEQQQIEFIDLAKEAGTQHIVLLSQYASATDAPVRFLRYHAAVEEHLRRSGIGATVLRPNLFMQGLMMFSETIKSQHAFFAPIGDARISAVDVRDIGDVAALALATNRPLGTIDLTGPAALTHTDMADALANELGHDVAFHEVSPTDFAAALDGLLPAWQLAGLLEDYEHYGRGEAAEVSDNVAKILGRAPRDIRDFAALAAPGLR